MKQTLFHRATDAMYADTCCDCATIPVSFVADDEPAGYLGATWGEHPEPPACLHWTVLELSEEPGEGDPDPILAVLDAWGIKKT
jgi:hypothetical protein